MADRTPLAGGGEGIRGGGGGGGAAATSAASDDTPAHSSVSISDGLSEEWPTPRGGGDSPRSTDYDSFNAADFVHQRAAPSNSEMFESGQTYNSVAQSTARFLDRSHDFKQSRGQLNIRREQRVYGLYALDWFHSILNLNTTYVVIIGFFMYIVSFVFFAGLYYLVSDGCNIGLETFISAVYFSVETMVTIGYGTQDTFFNECGIMAFLITVQSLLAIFLDSVFIGLVFSRLGRAQQRAASVVFSDKAVIQQIDGQLHFMFQVVEIRDQAFVEASVRCIALRHIYDPTKQRTVWFQHSRMRLQQPDDERDSLLFMALPSTVVHRIDRWSPFMPPASWDNDHRGIFNEQEDLRQFAAARNRASQGFSAPEHNPLRGYKFPDLLLRDSDAEDGQRSGQACKTCGNTFRTQADLSRHQAYCEVDDRIAGHDMSGTSCGDCGESFGSEVALQLHRKDTGHSSYFSGAEKPLHFHRETKTEPGASEDVPPGTYPRSPMSHVRSGHNGNSAAFGADDRPEVETADILERRRISQWMLDCDLEILCLVEGMDPITSDTVQALHSYAPSDIVWDRQFAPCVFPAAPVADRRCCGMRPMLRHERHRRSRMHSEGRLEIDLDRFHELITLDHPAALDRPSHL